ncbi:hypothetical protein SteCoe_20491 [Stentor coeruleus]|uniref:Uncharacterized protein n=1 Tax=Stentor coeruleus TaxID=5963 RepID=A0A1R2BRM2_9CILI|nr:hypothetical protein SteCoe_20491 [Stentor coeruleus]
MLENQLTQENTTKPIKSSSQIISRAPLQNMSYENLPQPIAISSQNPQLVKIYSEEIFEFLKSTEEETLIKGDYFLLHTEINHTSRAFLIDWLINIHLKFRLLQETLFIAVNLIDKYLSKRMITKKQLQLVGITAIFIASKYEEIYPPNARDFLIITNQAYSKQHLLKMEVDMLKAVDFNITFPTAWRFMDKYSDILHNGSGQFAELLLELGLVEYVMIKYRPSIQAAAAVYLANSMLKKTFVWKNEEDDTFKECVKETYKIFKSSLNHPLVSVRDKYLRKKLDLVMNDELRYNQDF